MNEIKEFIMKVVNWFKELSKLKQIIVVGIAIISVIFAGSFLIKNDLDGSYSAEKDGITIVVSIHGNEGNLVMIEGDEKHEGKIEKINSATKTFTLKDPDRDLTTEMTFKKEGDILRLSDGSSDDELILIKNRRLKNQ
ncbi:hypothetical protein [Streptococcus oralis]|uniref:hypothetical protein n=1 Tax=Streptococcus oralis TaxID=1303 RepID=UPI002000EBAB|nr:hypothetical protein [Streptococcus oralis]